VEIEILHDLKHENIIQLLDAYFYDNKLWVSRQQRFVKVALAKLRSVYLPIK
jgi:serine/threonine protein kinase